MRLKPLPDSIPVLESLLRSVEKWLEANSYPDRVLDRATAHLPREGPSIAEIF
jgi:hypothetical protein